MDTKKIKHRGRFSQVFIYLGKLFRMFIFQNDWKVFPMAAVIAGLEAFPYVHIPERLEGISYGCGHSRSCLLCCGGQPF